MLHLGELFYRTRKAKGITQKDASAAIEISQNALVQIEKGNAFPHHLTIKRLLELYGMTEMEMIISSANSDDIEFAEPAIKQAFDFFHREMSKLLESNRNKLLANDKDN